MEETHIKKRRAIWPWVLVGLIVLVGIIYFAFFSDKNNMNTDIVGTNGTTQPADASGPVREYISYVRADTAAMDLSHEYSSQALSKLIQAIKAKAGERGFEVQSDLAQADKLAEEIQKEPYATTHANSIRTAADIISTSLQNLQKAHYPNLDGEARSVRDAATAIDQNKLTLDQKNEVKAFLKETADLLEKMS